MDLQRSLWRNPAPEMEGLNITELHAIIGPYSVNQDPSTGFSGDGSLSQPSKLICSPDYFAPARLQKPGLIHTFNFLRQKHLPNPWIDVSEYFEQMQLNLDYGVGHPIHLITGINGSGKSTLASYYASEWLKTTSEKNIIWLNASSREALERDFAAVSRRFNVGAVPSNVDQVLIHFVYETLGNFPTLIVFDDAEDSIIEYLPKPGNGPTNKIRIIVTTQNTSFLNGVDHDPLQIIHLGPVKPEERNKLLAEVINNLPNGLHYDETEGAEFAEHFDSLMAPLISGTKALRRKNQKLAKVKTGERYTLRDFNDHIAEWIAEEKTMDCMEPKDHDSPREILFQPLRNLWEIEFHRFGDVEFGWISMAVLDAAAFMSSNGQPEEWMRQVFHEAQPPPERNVQEDALVYLEERSLVERRAGGGAVVAHKVVSMVRRGLKEQNLEDRDAYVRALRERIAAAGAHALSELINANVEALETYMARNNVILEQNEL